MPEEIIREGKRGLFSPETVRKMTGEFSKECAIELLKEGKYGKRMTRANFAEHKNCIRKKWEKFIKEKLGVR